MTLRAMVHVADNSFDWLPHLWPVSTAGFITFPGIRCWFLQFVNLRGPDARLAWDFLRTELSFRVGRPTVSLDPMLLDRSQDRPPMYRCWSVMLSPYVYISSFWCNLFVHFIVLLAFSFFASILMLWWWIVRISKFATLNSCFLCQIYFVCLSICNNVYAETGYTSYRKTDRPVPKL